MREDDFQATVIEMAQRLGWKVAHFRPAKTEKGWRTAVAADGAGFPDLVLVRHRILFAELKTDRGKLSRDQVVWQDAIIRAEDLYLDQVGQGYDSRYLPFKHVVWRPRDLKTIEEVLRGR